MTTRADLEARFIKRFSSRRFVTLLNSLEGVAENIERELRGAIRDLTESITPNVKFYVPLDCEEAELAAVAAPGGKDLHRSLYQQSMFFKDIVGVSVSSKTGLLLHKEVGVVKTAGVLHPKELDTFHQYVLLHFFDYIIQRIADEVEQEKELNAQEALKEVVIDKISLLRTTDEPTEE